MATFGTFVDGVSLKASEINGLFTSVQSLPVIRQPGVILASSGVLGRYFIVNKLVFYNFNWRTTAGSGSANNRIELDLPVTAASNSMRVIGQGLYSDFGGSPSTFRVAIVQVSTTRAAFLSETTTSLTTYVGQTNGPGFTIGDNDSLSGTIVYQAA
jgi:hypothetical protein